MVAVYNIEQGGKICQTPLMDPLDPSSFNHRVLALSTGRAYHFIDQLPKNYDAKKTVSVVLVHGFPDFWYANMLFGSAYSSRETLQVWMAKPKTAPKEGT